MSTKYFYRAVAWDHSHGPVSAAEIRRLAILGEVVPLSHLRIGNDGHWFLAEEVEGLFKDVGFQIKKDIFGRYSVGYHCRRCKERLKSSLNDAGKPDVCPECRAEFIVPGEEDLRRINSEKQSDAALKKQRKEAARIAKRQARRDEAAAARAAKQQTAAEAARTAKPKKFWEVDITPITNIFLGGLLFLLFCVWSISGPPSGSSPPSDADYKFVGRQRLKAVLKDPDSLEIIKERVVRPGRNGGKVGYHVEYRAKNGFGGYTLDEFYTE